MIATGTWKHVKRFVCPSVGKQIQRLILVAAALFALKKKNHFAHSETDVGTL